MRIKGMRMTEGRGFSNLLNLTLIGQNHTNLKNQSCGHLLKQIYLKYCAESSEIVSLNINFDIVLII